MEHPIRSALLIFAAALPCTARADEVTIGASKDNTLYENATGNASNGSGGFFFCGSTNRGQIRRGLVAFDVAATVPAGSTITSVRLTLHMAKTIAGAQAVELRRVTADWGEGVSNAGGSEGGGSPAAAGDATWIHTFFSTARWNTAGGDFAAVASASTSVAGVGSYTWGSSSGMVADVQGWLNDSASNFGWIILGNESASATAKSFSSRENLTAADRPALTIAFTPPVKAAAFRRGDTNRDGRTDIGDAICVLEFIFGGPESACKAKVAQCTEAGNSNDDGQIDIGDAIILLNHLFANGGDLPPPFGACGEDPTPGGVGCEVGNPFCK